MPAAVTYLGDGVDFGGLQRLWRAIFAVALAVGGVLGGLIAVEKLVGDLHQVDFYLKEATRRLSTGPEWVRAAVTLGIAFAVLVPSYLAWPIVRGEPRAASLGAPEPPGWGSDQDAPSASGPDRDSDQIAGLIRRISSPERSLWERALVKPVALPSRAQGRRPTFLSVVNLKGGVGKTTLSANLGALFATGVQGLDARRVLLVDLDFQGSLSGLCVSDSVIANAGQTTTVLLAPETVTSDALRVAIKPSFQTDDLHVMVADDTLDSADLAAMARFLLTASPSGEADLRHRYRDLFLRQEVFGGFDLVIFDCPPRATMSAVNAVAVSDFVLVPTQLTALSVQAVPRTLEWLNRRRDISSAEVVGIALNQVALYRDAYTKAHQNAFGMLRVELAKRKLTARIFEEEMVRHMQDLATSTVDQALPALRAVGQDAFLPLATALEEIMFPRGSP